MTSIVVNGEAVDVPADSTLGDLIAARGLSPSEVAAEVNQDLVPRAKRAEQTLVEGDRVELVTMVGGG